MIEVEHHFGISPLRYPPREGSVQIRTVTPAEALTLSFSAPPYWYVEKGNVTIITEPDGKVVSDALKFITPEGKGE